MNEEVMEEILKAAKEEFLTLGYTEASMRNIESHNWVVILPFS